MKKVFLPSLAIAAILFSNSTKAQSNRAFAVTSETKGSYNWNIVREIDLATGEVVRTIYDPSVNKKVVYDAAVANAELKVDMNRFPYPTAQGVAATAYDAEHNRLYFTNMRGDDLRYFDLNSGEIKVVVNNDSKFNTGVKYDEANVITRMAFSSDGFGYALTNDGKNLVRFSTDKKPVVTNLGQLIDGKSNGQLSVHSQCSSWGGDMVGDAYGNLYLVTMRNHIFKINPQTRVADYVGQVKGLPAEFTSNGMAVSNDGDIVLSSAMIPTYYKVNVSTLEAQEVKKKDDNVYNASDLANSNLLYQKNNLANDLVRRTEVTGNHLLSVYPNPVANKNFTVQFDKVNNGQYILSLTDVSGRLVYQKALNINVSGQMERVTLPRATAGGMYLLKLSGSDNKVVFSDKIVVQ